MYSRIKIFINALEYWGNNMRTILTGILSLFIFFGSVPTAQASDMSNKASMEEVKKKKKKKGRRLVKVVVRKRRKDSFQKCLVLSNQFQQQNLIR